MDFQGTERYQVTGRLGAGSFGQVFQAVDRLTGQQVALKVLRQLDPEALYRFKKEFRSLADLSHPNLVTLHELLSDGDQWLFSMELVEGVDFVAYVRGDSSGPGLAGEQPTRDLSPSGSASASHRSGGVLDEGRLRDALAQLAQGVTALHRAGRLHRDLKPSNVLVTPDGRVVVLDFGLVTDLGPDRSTTDQIVGTAAYMPPEQALGSRVTEEADWYSVGVMLYEALTGRLPYEGQRLQVLMDKQRHDPPPPESQAPGVPADLSALCMELLDRRPDRRPGDAEVLQRTARGSHAASGMQPDRASPDQGAPFDRREELLALERALAASREGTAAIVHICGPANSGKTALVRQFLDQLQQESQALVLTAQCYERESVPFKAVDSLMDALCRHLRRLDRTAAGALLPDDTWALARLFPVLERAEAVAAAPRPGGDSSLTALRRRAFAALRELFTRIARRRPVVLFIDDVQWDDADSAALLEAVMGAPEPPALMLLLGYREEEAAASHILAGLAQARRGKGFACEMWKLRVSRPDSGASLPDVEVIHEAGEPRRPAVPSRAQVLAPQEAQLSEKEVLGSTLSSSAGELTESTRGRSRPWTRYPWIGGTAVLLAGLVVLGLQLAGQRTPKHRPPAAAVQPKASPPPAAVRPPPSEPASKPAPQPAPALEKKVAAAEKTARVRPRRAPRGKVRPRRPAPRPRAVVEPPAQTATLQVATLEGNQTITADLYIDGKKAGQSPLYKEGLAPGTYFVEARLQGYQRSFKKVRLPSGGEVSIVLKLRR